MSDQVKHSDDEVVILSVNVLEQNDWNPNSIPDPVYRALVENIRRTGFVQPILVRKKGEDGQYEVVDGAHRLTAAIEVGLAEVPVVIKKLTDAEARAQTLAMNKLRGEMEPADVAALVREIHDEISLQELAEFTGYQFEELDALNKLADFDFDQFDEEGDEEVNPDEDWVTLTFRVPTAIEAIFLAELDRVKHLLDTDHDHMALEMMAVNSSQTPAESVT